MSVLLACQSTHQGFLASRVQNHPCQADWDWTPVWHCLPEAPEPRGSLRFDLWETRNTQKNSALASSTPWITMTRSSASARIIFYYLLIHLLYTEKVIFACVESISEVKIKAQKEEGQVSNRLWDMPVSLSCRKNWAHIYISDSFSKHSDRHFQHWHFHENVTHSLTHTHRRMYTHI